MAKLDECAVERMRVMAAAGAPLKELPVVFGVSYNSVVRIVRGQTWRHAGGPITPRPLALTRDETRALSRERYVGEDRTRHLAKRKGLEWSPELHERLEAEKRERDAFRALSPEAKAAHKRDYSQAYNNTRRGPSAGETPLKMVDRLMVLERADGECGICGGDVDPFCFHVDHIVPIARGGAHHLSNLQAAHPTCNRRKHARLPEEMTV